VGFVWSFVELLSRLSSGHLVMSRAARVSRERLPGAPCDKFQVNVHVVVLPKGWWAWPILCFLTFFGRHFLFPGVSVHILNCFKFEIISNRKIFKFKIVQFENVQI
jgi:hypothetical protein